MSTSDFITELFCRVDDAMHDVEKHRQASLHPGEVVTLGLLFAIKGVGNRAFYKSCLLQMDQQQLSWGVPHPAGTHPAVPLVLYSS